MKNLSMFCLTLEPSHLNFIKSLNYIPVGLGQKNFTNEWLNDKTGKNISKKIKIMASIHFIIGFGKITLKI